jgi:hypothetical protein
MKRLIGLGLIAVAVAALGGCVERRIKVNTSPQGARVVLNDEQIGVSPVTVSFQWYGDYAVRISKEGYQTLVTHRPLKAPWYDAFPFDFFAQVLWPGRIVDDYEWTFELQPAVPVQREDLVHRAEIIEEEAKAQ